MRRLAPALFTACLAAVPLAGAWAGTQDFKLVNKTGYQIDRVYVTEVGNRSWGHDVTGRDALAEGEAVTISFEHGLRACRWNLKVEYGDGAEATWRNLNLCNISRVRLFWNERTQKTTAKVD